ncbi:MAG: hypothetical protein KF798_06645 [Candidatus Paracaedibacteraceae bacterium]|nr:hypothetical protein [Candidatus Paracaedibacteraceae bacterium]
MDVSTALFTAANALHNNYATTAEREASSSHDAGYDTDEKADQQAYGKYRKKAIDKVTPELVKKYGQAAAEYAHPPKVSGPDGYAERRDQAVSGA